MHIEPKVNMYAERYTICLTPEQLYWMRNATANEHNNAKKDSGATKKWVARCRRIVHEIDSMMHFKTGIKLDDPDNTVDADWWDQSVRKGIL